MNLYSDVLDTPLGRFLLETDADGALVRCTLGGLPGSPADPGPARAARRELEAYFAGTLRTFTVATRPRGTDFQRRVWRALEAIPFGHTRSYGELARDLGSAARAVGAAAGANPIPVVIPCHRLIGADGSLTGFALGTDVKRRLLAHEQGGELFA